MRFNEYQEATRATAVYPKKSGVEYCALGLASEAGEVAGKVKKWIRDGQPLNQVKDELGDVLWYIARLADECGWNMHDIAASNIYKLNSRKERGVLLGNGDTR